MQKFGTGSAIQQGIQAATAAVQGLTGGNLAQAIAGGAAPYLAGVIKQTVGEDNPAANLMAHAAVNAALALVKGENAASAAAGAAVGEAMGMIALSYYNKPVSELSEEEKQTVSTLATLAAGLAGGLIGDSLSDSAGGAQAGKTTVENNTLALVARGCAALSPCRNKIAEQLLEIGAKAGIAGLAGATIKDMADKMTPDELDHLITLIMVGNNEFTNRYLSELRDKYSTTIAIDPNDVPKLEGLPIPDEPGGTALVNPVPERDRNEGIYTNPEQEQDKNAGVLPGSEISAGDWRDNVYTADNKASIDSTWHEGSFGSSGDSLQKHFEKHGKEVSATSVEQYLRKAQAFADDLRGASRVSISGATENVTRYYKNGKYIDIAGDDRIISFGKQ